MKLTDRGLRALPPGVYPDGGNLYLRVHQASKVFVYRDRRGGKDSWITLGAYPTLSLLSARAQALARRQGRPASRMTFQQGWDVFYERIASKYSRPEELASSVRRDVMPYLGSRTLAAVTRADVSSVLRKILERGAPVMANRTLSYLKRFFRYARGQGWIEANPLDLLTRNDVGGRERSRERTLDWDEISALC